MVIKQQIAAMHVQLKGACSDFSCVVTLHCGPSSKNFRFLILNCEQMAPMVSLRCPIEDCELYVYV